MVAPNARDFVNERLRGMRVLVNVRHRKVGCDMRPDQREERARDQREKDWSRGVRHRQEPRVSHAKPDHWRAELDERNEQGEDEGEVAQFDDHGFSLQPLGARLFLLAALLLPAAILLESGSHFRGHVFLIVLRKHGVGDEHAIRANRAFGHDALTFAEQIGEDSLIGHGKRRRVGDGERGYGVRLFMLPSFTRPPSRNRVPGFGMVFSTSSGLIKNVTCVLSALKTSAGASPTMTSPTTMTTARRCFRVMAAFAPVFLRLKPVINEALAEDP